MPFSYYEKLSRRDRAIYRKSDALPDVHSRFFKRESSLMRQLAPPKKPVVKESVQGKSSRQLDLF